MILITPRLIKLFGKKCHIKLQLLLSTANDNNSSILRMQWLTSTETLFQLPFKDNLSPLSSPTHPSLSPFGTSPFSLSLHPLPSLPIKTSEEIWVNATKLPSGVPPAVAICCIVWLQNTPGSINAAPTESLALWWALHQSFKLASQTIPNFYGPKCPSPPKKNGRPVVSRTPQTCLSPAPTKSRHTLIYCSMLMKYREWKIS